MSSHVDYKYFPSSTKKINVNQYQYRPGQALTVSRMSRLPKFIDNKNMKGGTRWRSWLRHCATSFKVVGSISGGVNGFFH
jgi:hypothetical protein